MILKLSPFLGFSFQHTDSDKGCWELPRLEDRNPENKTKARI